MNENLKQIFNEIECNWIETKKRLSDNSRIEKVDILFESIIEKKLIKNIPTLGSPRWFCYDYFSMDNRLLAIQSDDGHIENYLLFEYSGHFENLILLCESKL